MPCYAHSPQRRAISGPRDSSTFLQGQQKMADQEPATGSNGSGETGADPAISILAQYTKDLSVENPSAPQVFQWQVQPNLDVQFNINVESVADDVHEVVLKIEVNARSDNGVHFVVDLSYGGLFRNPQRSGGRAPAVPFDRSTAADLPLCAPDRRRSGQQQRIPAAPARSDRFCRRLSPAIGSAAAARCRGGQRRRRTNPAGNSVRRLTPDAAQIE